MAGNEPQKQLLSLIRDFATEKSLGERRIENLKKKIEQLRSEVYMGNVELDEAKRRKETTEQEFKGHEVEMAMIDASILALEARISSTQGEISAVGSDLESLRNEEGSKRDDFIKKMFALNQDIRVFQASVAALNEEYKWTGSTSDDAEVYIRDIENKLAEIISQTNLVEQEYQTEQKIHELEEKCASVGDELQRRFLCPSCHQDNSESLDGILQTI